MKKWVWMGVVLISMLAVVAGNSRADESHYEYTVSGGMATITAYTGPGGDIIVPSTLGGYSVNTIGDLAFIGQNLTSGIGVSPCIAS